MTHISEFDRNDSDGSGPKVSHGRVFVAPAGTEFVDAKWTEIGYATLDHVLDIEGGEDLDWHPPFYIGDFPPPQPGWRSWTTTFPIDPESDSLALLMGKPTRAELQQQIEDLKREVQFWKQMVDDVAEDYERELERLEDQRINVHVEPISNEALDLVSDLIAKSLRKHYRAL